MELCVGAAAWRDGPQAEFRACCRLADDCDMQPVASSHIWLAFAKRFFGTEDERFQSLGLSINLTLEVVGDRRSLLVIRDLRRAGVLPLLQTTLRAHAMASEQDAYDELRCYTLAHRDPSFIHQHVVDAFTTQHADAQTKPIALTFSLVGLYLFVQRQLSGRQVQRVHMELARHKQPWPAFVLPLKRGSITAVDVVAAPEGPERDKAVHAWCTSVWGAFHHSHRTVIDLLREHGFHDRPASPMSQSEVP
jgi:hypothetical protein